jgi:hypothetical protein
MLRKKSHRTCKALIPAAAFKPDFKTFAFITSNLKVNNWGPCPYNPNLMPKIKKVPDSRYRTPETKNN